MDGIVAAVTYIETHPGVAALLEIATIAAVIWLHRSSKQGREKLHRRIDRLSDQFSDHEKRDERVLGEIRGELRVLNRTLNGQEAA